MYTKIASFCVFCAKTEKNWIPIWNILSVDLSLGSHEKKDLALTFYIIGWWQEEKANRKH